MCTKSYSTRFLYFSLYFCIRLYRVLNFFLYEAVPPCDTQLPLHGKVKNMAMNNILKGSCVSRGGGDGVPLTKNRLS